MAKVFITQKIKVDFQQVTQHGEPVFLSVGREDLWGDGQDSELIGRLELGLRDFDEDNDFIVLAGSPYVNATVMLILGRMHVRSVQFLRWDNSKLYYTRLAVALPVIHDYMR